MDTRTVVWGKWQVVESIMFVPGFRYAESMETGDWRDLEYSTYSGRKVRERAEAETGQRRSRSSSGDSRREMMVQRDRAGTWTRSQKDGDGTVLGVLDGTAAHFTQNAGMNNTCTSPSSPATLIGGVGACHCLLGPSDIIANPRKGKSSASARDCGRVLGWPPGKDRTENTTGHERGAGKG